jgi:iron complex transport system substrate-binding protein
MRRPFVLALALLVTVALLGACSSDDDSSSSGDAAEGTSTDDSAPGDGEAASTQTEATTVEHEFGTTEVPADPIRIAALGEEYLLADLFSLGLGDRVTVSTSTVGDPRALEDLGFDVGDITFYVPQETDVEQLYAEEPDLILAQPYVVDEVGYEILSGIAPTVPVVQTDDWQGNYRELAATFGPQVEAEADAQLADYDEAVASAGDELGAADRTVSVATVYPGPSVVAWAEGPIDVPATLLDMGFTLSPDASDGDTDASGRISLSLEQLGLLDGEDLVLLQTDAVEGEDVAVEDVESEALWQGLPAVESDRVLTVDRLGYPGLPGRLALIGVLETELATS